MSASATRPRILLLTALCCGAIAWIASGPRPATHTPDAPPGAEESQDRAEWELMRLRDPATGAVPFGIRNRELAFARRLPSRQQNFMAKPGLIGPDFQWRSRGPVNVGGRTRAIGIDVSNPDVIIAASVTGGVYRSADRGLTWLRTTPLRGLPGASCLAQDIRPAHRNVWYYGTGEASAWAIIGAADGKRTYPSEGIFKSVDSGKSWQPLALTLQNTPQVFDQAFDFVNTVVTDPANLTQDVVYAAVYGGVVRSVDGGQTWTTVLGRLMMTPYTDVAVTSTGVVYAYIGSNDTLRGLWRSPNGLNWTKISPPAIQDSCRRGVIGLVPGNPNALYLLNEGITGGSSRKGLWKYVVDSSGNGTWSDRSVNLPNTGSTYTTYDTQMGYCMYIRVKPDAEDTVFIGATNLFRSTDGFQTRNNTQIIGGYESNGSYSLSSPVMLHPDMHMITFMPQNPRTAIAVGDGGVRIATDVMTTPKPNWTSLNTGYVTGQFYSVSIDHATPASQALIGGLQDNGSWGTSAADSAAPWTNLLAGDGMFACIADGGRVVYVSSQGANIMQGGMAATATNRVQPQGMDGANRLFVHPFTLDPANTNIMYIPVGSRIYRNTDLTRIPINTATNWTSIPNAILNPSNASSLRDRMYSAIGVSRENPAHRVYAGTVNGRVFRFDDADQGVPTPVEVTSNLFPAGAYVSCIAVDPQNADAAIVAFSNYNIRSLFATQDGGASWISISANLEENQNGTGDGPSCRWAAVMRHGADVVYFVGTSAGLYSTGNLNGDNTVWSLEGASAMGNAVVEMVDIRQSDGFVAVATHGQGIFTGIAPSVGVRDEAVNGGAARSMTVYPNPVHTDMTVQVDLPVAGLAELSLYDGSGRRVARLLDRTLASGTHSLHFDISGLPAGRYFCRLSTPRGQSQYPVLKQ